MHSCMDQSYSVQTLYSGIVERANALGISLNKLCARAKVARSTLVRWRSGSVSPNFASLQKIEEALAAFERSKRA